MAGATTQTRTGFAALVLLGAGLLPATSGADDGLLRCAKLERSDERLACYDELARTMQSSSGEPVDASPSASYLSRAWKLGPTEGGVRHLADILSYRPNYIMLRWTDSPNVVPRSPATGRASLGDLNPVEAKIQASFKTELVSRQAFERAGVTQALSHVGIDSVRLWFAHTQKMDWQVFNHGNSRPLRETNYEPELILTLGRGNPGNGLKLINLGLVHESNGLDHSQHRGWTRAYAQGGWEWDSLSVLARAWHVIEESDDDNPNIRRFSGSGDLVTRYQTAGGYVTSALMRGNLGTRRGFVQLDWATPRLNWLGAFRFHVQLTNGYGETLIDYNHKQTTVGAGVSFGDW
jgi:phospholipase A1